MRKACLTATILMLLSVPGVLSATNSGSYSLADLVGTWEANDLVAGSVVQGWQRGRLTVAADGSLHGKITNSAGGTQTLSGTLSISAQGVITSPDLG